MQGVRLVAESNFSFAFKKPQTTNGSPFRNQLQRFIAFTLAILIATGCVKGQENSGKDKAARTKIPAPDLVGGSAWLNTSKPISLKDLKGKIVLLDFWTLCCINCIHTLPDLEKLEKKWGKELVVIGVHSPKFDNEKSTASIRKALLRYEVAHPVVNDSERKIWESYGIESWPTLVLIDPDGNFVARGAGEGLYDAVDEAISELVKKHRASGTLNEAPLKFQLETEKTQNFLKFPGKVITDQPGKQLFIADSTNHRIVCSTPEGQVLWTAGTGKSGSTDGTFQTASFNDPQGMAWVGGMDGDKLLVADRKNHTIRQLDLIKKTVTTIAGTGKQGQDRRSGGPGLKDGLNSPWDLWLEGTKVYVAMAGHHQIWVLDLPTKNITPYAGSGRETLMDGELPRSCFAQPSGLTSDGKNLFVADSETSSVRSLPIVQVEGSPMVSTLVGTHLFKFGDKDGIGDEALLQHALGVTWLKDKIYVADTYNNKLKTIDPKTRLCQTFMEGFQEPGGIWANNGLLYVADTNAHRIVVIDPASKKMKAVNISPAP